MICVCPQSTAVTNLQLDSDMADITQSLPAESVLGGEEEDIQPWDTDTAGGRLGAFIPPEQDGASASGQIASSLGINPHTLQVKKRSTAESSIFTHRCDKGSTSPASFFFRS